MSATPDFGAAIAAVLSSDELALVRAKAGFAIALGLFLVMFLWPAQNQSIVARRVVISIRALLTVQFALLAILLNYVVTKGSPWPAALSSSPIPLLPGKTDWLFSIWRPLTVFLTVGAGVMMASSPFPKYICIVGCCWDIMQDLVSMVQIGSYMSQVSNFGAPLVMYNSFDLSTLYWRDIVALGVSSLILFQTMHLFVLQGAGLGGRPDISWQQITGGLQDRSHIMCWQRYSRLSDEIDTAHANSARKQNTKSTR